MCQEITISVMPARLTAEDIDAVKRDPLCWTDDQDEIYKRIGWLICAYDAIVAARLKTPRARGNTPYDEGPFTVTPNAKVSRGDEAPEERATGSTSARPTS